MDASIERCRRAVCWARERLGAPAPVLLCTDSADVEIAARQVIPMGNWKRPLADTVYDLRRRYDDGDPLSPAVIM